MEKYIITIARQYGSGGKIIGEMLAKLLEIPCYNREILKMASEDSGINESLFNQVDEKLNLSVLHRFLKKSDTKRAVLSPEDDDFTSEENLFNYQAKIIKELAEQESCVIMGRCADFILKEHPRVIRVFIWADEEFCLKTAMQRSSMSETETKKFIAKTDKYRSNFYKYHTGHEWTNVKNYDLCLNSGKLGIEKCVEIIKDYKKIKED